MKSNDIKSFNSRLSENKIFYRELYPIIFVMKILGISPMVRVKNNTLTAKLCSWNTVYFIFITAFYVSLLTMFFRLAPAKNINTFAAQVWEIMRMYVLVLLMVIPITIWAGSSCITNYFHSWTAFQNHFQVSTGKILCFSLHRKCFIWISLILGFHFTKQIVFICTENEKTSTEFKVIYTIAFILTMVMRDTLCLYWFANCTALTIAANKTAKMFIKNFRDTRIPLHTVMQYRTLWMDLSRLARQLGEAHCYTYCFYILYVFLVITMMVYNSIFMFIRRDVSRIWLYPMEISCISLWFLTFCNAGNKATEKIKNTFSPHLLDISATSLNRDAAREAKIFLKAIEHFPPVISLNQYVDINKRLIVSVSVTLVTYLIVLVQFDVSASQDDELVTTTAITTPAAMT